MKFTLTTAAIAGLLAARGLQAQAPSPAVHVGFGVDTAIADVRNVVRLVRAYLARPDSSAQERGLWDPSDKLFARAGDVAASQAYQGFPATVVGVIPVDRQDSVYTVRILHALADAQSGAARPLAVQRLFAVRDRQAPFGFRLTSPLLRLTRDWARLSAGRLTFRYAPGLSPNTGRIRRAVAFVDSLARMFAVEPPEQIDAYVAATVEEAQRAIGLDFTVDASGPGEGRGARTLRGNIILIGDDRIGEAYLHELVHAVLNPTLRGRTYLWSEGVATWLGGSRGRSLSQMYLELQALQRAQRTMSLRSLLRRHEQRGGKTETDAVVATGALIMEAVYARHGTTGVRALAGLPTYEAILQALPSYLGLANSNDATIDEWWRSATMGSHPMRMDGTLCAARRDCRLERAWASWPDTAHVRTRCVARPARAADEIGHPQRRPTVAARRGRPSHARPNESLELTSELRLRPRPRLSGSLAAQLRR